MNKSPDSKGLTTSWSSRSRIATALTLSASALIMNCDADTPVEEPTTTLEDLSHRVAADQKSTDEIFAVLNQKADEGKIYPLAAERAKERILNGHRQCENDPYARGTGLHDVNSGQEFRLSPEECKIRTSLNTLRTLMTSEEQEAMITLLENTGIVTDSEAEALANLHRIEAESGRKKGPKENVAYYLFAYMKRFRLSSSQQERGIISADESKELRTKSVQKALPELIENEVNDWVKTDFVSEGEGEAIKKASRTNIAYFELFYRIKEKEDKHNSTDYPSEEQRRAAKQALETQKRKATMKLRLRNHVGLSNLLDKML